MSKKPFLLYLGRNGFLYKEARKMHATLDGPLVLQTTDLLTADFCIAGGVKWCDPPVRFRSGILSPILIDCSVLHRRALNLALYTIYKAKLQSVPALQNTRINSCIFAGMEAGGISGAAIIAHHFGADACVIRKNNFSIEGAPVAGRTVVLVEDVVTMATNSVQAIKAIREADGKVVLVLSHATYGFAETIRLFSRLGVDHATVLTYQSIRKILESRWPMKQIREVDTWYKNPSAWS